MQPQFEQYGEGSFEYGNKMGRVVKPWVGWYRLEYKADSHKNKGELEPQGRGAEDPDEWWGRETTKKRDKTKQLGVHDQDRISG